VVEWWVFLAIETGSSQTTFDSWISSSATYFIISFRSFSRVFRAIFGIALELIIDEGAGVTSNLLLLAPGNYKLKLTCPLIFLKKILFNF
jgi:hypothetical protein